MGHLHGQHLGIFADFLPRLPSQPRQTLPFNKHPGDIFEVENYRSRVIRHPESVLGPPWVGWEGLSTETGGHPPPFTAAFLSSPAASRSIAGSRCQL